MRVADLEALLERVERPADPAAALEQVRTPPGIAARFLCHAHAYGAIAGRRVLDLGCGTGILAWGAAILGARQVFGVDVDAGGLAQARRASLPATAPPVWQQADVRQWRAMGEWDTVVMNPPFGAQRANRGADRAFYDAACMAVAPAGQVWFLAQVRTEGFLEKMAAGHLAAIVRVDAWRYPLERQHAFHSQEARLLEVGAYRLEWPQGR